MAAANTAGPKIPANFSDTAKNPKNSPERWRGTMLAKSERESAWVPPWTSPTRTASAKKWAAVRVK